MTRRALPGWLTLVAAAFLGCSSTDRPTETSSERDSLASSCDAPFIVPQECAQEVRELELLTDEVERLPASGRGHVRRALEAIDALADNARRNCARQCNANLQTIDELQADVVKACRKLPSACASAFAGIESVRGIEQARCSACPNGCSDHGICTALIGLCVCDLGASGTDCSACASGYSSRRGGTCQLTNDARTTEWPNQVSRANSDPWLIAHHDDIRILRPNVLVLLYAFLDAHYRRAPHAGLFGRTPSDVFKAASPSPAGWDEKSLREALTTRIRRRARLDPPSASMASTTSWTLATS